MNNIILAHTQGFCAGVASAIDIVDKVLEKYKPPIYVRHHIVHNTWVIRDFENKGVIFIEELEEVPSGATVVFSAHGIAPEVYEEAQRRGLTYIDATCPLVKKLHRQAIRYSERDIPTILIGHKGHQELIGTSGYVNKDLLFIVEDEDDIADIPFNKNEPVSFITQTTLSVSDTQHIINKLQAVFPEAMPRSKNDICFATQNRQDAIVELTTECDVIIVCGSPTSSNSNRLRETAENKGIDAYIIDSPDEIKWDWFEGKKVLGISSGASSPQVIVDALVEKVKNRYPSVTVSQGESIEEGIHFPLPAI